MEVILIAAVAANGVIGRLGKVPWTLREDLARFKTLTTGWPCVMGRLTWESLPRRPLPARENIVLSRSRPCPPALTFPSLDEALAHCRPAGRAYICGGEAVYRAALPAATRLELTCLHRPVPGDTFFPPLSGWREVWREEREEFAFVRYER